MKKNEINYSQLQFLYAYLRQIDLSLDRSRWGNWYDLQNYFKNRIQPNKVIEYIKYSFQLPDIDIKQFVFALERRTILEKIKYTIIKSSCLKQNEILYCCKLLLAFEKELKSDLEKYNLEIEKLRIDIAKYYTEILEIMISNKDLYKLMRIEHYLQSDKIKVTKLLELIPDDFQDKTNE